MKNWRSENKFGQPIGCAYICNRVVAETRCSMTLKPAAFMKNLLLAGFCLLIGLQAMAQTSFSDVVKKFIDYDTALIAFTHCRLADVKHLRVLEDQTVIVRNGIIAAVADSKTLPPPPGSTVVNLTGKSLLPGFVLL